MKEWSSIANRESHTIPAPSRLVSEVSGAGPPWSWHVPTQTTSDLQLLVHQHLMFSFREPSTLASPPYAMPHPGAPAPLSIRSRKLRDRNGSNVWAVMHRRFTGPHPAHELGSANAYQKLNATCQKSLFCLVLFCFVF